MYYHVNMIGSEYNWTLQDWTNSFTRVMIGLFYLLCWTDTNNFHEVFKLTAGVKLHFSNVLIFW